MLLKKQTVWLLTMLSLVVVLSVYYITSPEPKGNDLAGVADQEKKEAETAKKQNLIEAKDGKMVISGTESDEAFEALRMDLEDKRNKMIEDLEDIVASSDLPGDERYKAYDQMKQLNEIATKESVLETLIKAMGYEDALVRADGEQVRIMVKADKPSPSAANDIIQLVRTELGSLQAVAVEFQPKK